MGKIRPTDALFGSVTFQVGISVHLVNMNFGVGHMEISSSSSYIVDTVRLLPHKKR